MVNHPQGDGLVFVFVLYQAFRLNDSFFSKKQLHG